MEYRYILTSFIAAFTYGLPSVDVAKTITSGFGGILGYIGLVIVHGTIIGTMLKKSGAAITMADLVIKRLGKRLLCRSSGTWYTSQYFVTLVM